ncbi:MAG: PilN domain-containing protein [Gemmatimonadota bacterium]
MIEVNLLPGGKKRSSKGRGFSFSLPKLKGGGGGLPGDPYLLGAIGAGIVSVTVIVWLFLGVRSDREEVQVALDAALQDSVRFHDLIERTNQLTARRDSIAQRVAIIQEIDAGRYIWPHIMDEVARALPDYTWLTELIQVQAEPLQVRISGQAGSTFAITNFMRRLEASRFLRGVVLERSEQAQSGADQQDIVYLFDLTVSYDPPPLDELETVPLFETGVADQMAVPDSAGN